MSFHEDRQAFIVVGGCVFLQPRGDKRTVKDWCAACFNIAGHAWDTLLRGYTLGNTVTFFTGGDMYTPAVDLSVSDAFAYREQLTCLDALYDDSGDIYNGVRPLYGEDVVWPRVFVLHRGASRWQCNF